MGFVTERPPAQVGNILPGGEPCEDIGICTEELTTELIAELIAEQCELSANLSRCLGASCGSGAGTGDKSRDKNGIVWVFGICWDLAANLKIKIGHPGQLKNQDYNLNNC